jgi:hypothetical protein
VVLNLAQPTRCCTTPCSGGGRCLDVSGVPGTGKTATVLEVICALKRRRCAPTPSAALACRLMHTGCFMSWESVKLGLISQAQRLKGCL